MKIFNRYNECIFVNPNAFSLKWLIAGINEIIWVTYY